MNDNREMILISIILCHMDLVACDPSPSAFNASHRAVASDRCGFITHAHWDDMWGRGSIMQEHGPWVVSAKQSRVRKS